LLDGTRESGAQFSEVSLFASGAPAEIGADVFCRVLEAQIQRPNNTGQRATQRLSKAPLPFVEQETSLQEQAREPFCAGFSSRRPEKTSSFFASARGAARVVGNQPQRHAPKTLHKNSAMHALLSR